MLCGRSQHSAVGSTPSEGRRSPWTHKCCVRRLRKGTATPDPLVLVIVEARDRYDLGKGVELGIPQGAQWCGTKEPLCSANVQRDIGGLTPTMRGGGRYRLCY